MTVGIAAIADDCSDGPRVIISADQMLTTQQQSAIEHEHPETKLSRLATQLQTVEVLSVFAGGVSLAEDLRDNIDAQIQAILQNQQQNVAWSVQTVAEVAAEQYRALVRSKIENLVLSKYGLTMDDMSAQHQFKDSFFNDVWAKAEQVENEITQNLVLLMGGIDQSGAYIYEIGNSDVTGHNDIGYATIGSGTQPAQSEFIKGNYGRSEDFDTALATVTAANHRAKQARGVGGEVDLGIVKDASTTEFASDDTVKALIGRQREIDDEQERIKNEILDDQSIQWSAR